LIESIESRASGVASSLKTALPNAVSQIGDTASGIETAIPAVVSEVRSAANVVATAIPGAVDAIVPRNCSIGISQFCIGLAHTISCYPLPPTISDMIPSEIRNMLGEELQNIQNFDTIFQTALTRVTPTTIQNIWIAGLVLIFLTLISTLSSIYGFAFFRHRTWRVIYHLVAGLLFCIPFVLPVVILSALVSKARTLPGWIHVVQGELVGLFIGGLCCGMTLLATCISLLIKF
jgi:hypothetical protein